MTAFHLNLPSDFDPFQKFADKVAFQAIADVLPTLLSGSGQVTKNGINDFEVSAPLFSWRPPRIGLS